LYLRKWYLSLQSFLGAISKRKVKKATRLKIFDHEKNISAF